MGIGVEVVSIDEMVKEHLAGLDSQVMDDGESLGITSLRSHILHAFQENRDARESGGVNKLMLDSLRAYNGQYDPEDWAKIKAEGGSSIFMNLTSTKVRAAISWIKDILLASKQDAFSIKPTPEVELDPAVMGMINQRVTKEFTEMIEAANVSPETPEGQPQQEAPDPATTLKEINERKRDLYTAVLEEINKEAAFAFDIIETKIKDQMKEGKWDQALSEVIDDFCIFPTAFMKGPIVTVKKRLKWVNGEVGVEKDYVMMNKRVSPLDIYPSPEATCVDDGNFIEHLRMSRKEIASFIGVEPYKQEALRQVLERDEGKGYPAGMDTNIEDEKAREEMREDTHRANTNVFHGLHFFGTAPVKLLRQWELEDEALDGLDDEDEVDIEAILIGTEVIKCVINDDPLGRRPYYSASFQKRPGSIWGTAPPYLMRDIQKMCNACARALSNNMGLSSGPIMELVVDRLADGQEVQQLRPRDIVQTKTDPMGNSQRAVSFFNIPSNAQELLTVYKEFEVKADDVTMIPRYAYGNERTGGAAQTASGLSMLLESASKGIKDAIRHIDEGIIIPRVEQEFYITMLRGNLEFTGDINVIAEGSQTLTMAGAQQMRRNEFLQVTANPTDQEIMGPEGRAEILRVTAQDLGLGENIVPNRQELKAKEKEKAKQQGQPDPSVQAAQIQNETNYKISQERNQISAADLERKTKKDQADVQLKAQDQQLKGQTEATKATAKLAEADKKIASEEHRADQAIALSLETGDKANNV